MGKSPHKKEHERKKAVRKSQLVTSEPVETPKPTPFRLKKNLIRPEEQFPKKKKRLKRLSSRLDFLEDTMKRKKRKHNFKESRRTTPRRNVDHETTEAHSHPQRGFRFQEINLKHVREDNRSIQKKLSHRKK